MQRCQSMVQSRRAFLHGGTRHTERRQTLTRDIVEESVEAGGDGEGEERGGEAVALGLWTEPEVKVK